MAQPRRGRPTHRAVNAVGGPKRTNLTRVGGVVAVGEKASAALSVTAVKRHLSAAEGMLDRLEDAHPNFWDSFSDGRSQDAAVQTGPPESRCALHVAHLRYDRAMARPTSFRLPEDLLLRLEEEAANTGSTVTALVSGLLDEGLKTRRFPGIVYRDGPAGRRAGLVGGPDVWELVRVVKGSGGEGDQRRQVADELGLPLAKLALAIDFYVAFPDEVDERVAADERAAARLRELIERRDRLMSG